MTRIDTAPIPREDPRSVVTRAMQGAWTILQRNAIQQHPEQEEAILQTDQPHALHPDIQGLFYDESIMGVRQVLQDLSKHPDKFAGLLAVRIQGAHKKPGSELDAYYYFLAQTHTGELFAGNPGDVESFDPKLTSPRPLVAYSPAEMLSRLHSRTGGRLPSERKIAEVLNDNDRRFPTFAYDEVNRQAVLRTVCVSYEGKPHGDQTEAFELFPIGNPQVQQRT